MTTDDDKHGRHEAGDPKLDLSALDPTRDTLRFERMARSLAAKAVEQRARQADPLSFAVRWWRPALGLAACLAALAWAPSLLASSPASSQAATTDPSAKLLSWASGEGPSSAVDVLEALGRTP